MARSARAFALTATSMQLPSLLPRFRRSLRGWRLGAFGAAVACLTAAGSSPLPAPTIAGVAGMLGARVRQIVLPADVRWEPSRGEAADLVLGRRVLFLASEAPGGPRD